jgi:catechol-2,3-dioxygenase
MNEQKSQFSSKYISHYGIRTKKLAEMIDWYQAFFDAEIRYGNESAAFLTFDDEHHRLVLRTDPDTKEKPENIAGVDHIGIGLPDFAALVASYERLKARGIAPFLPVNHRFTTSLYYHDPEGNEIELSVDNFPSKEERAEFVASERMAAILEPPFGDVFDPDELVRRFREGAGREELAHIGRQ